MSSPSTGGTEGSSPASSPASGTSLAMAAPKFGTLVPNRIFVGGISANTSEAELTQLFSAYGNVKATKIIADRAGVSKGYGFVTFETEEEAKRLQQESECIVLKERKLNIAPAIKKQPFNRSFDNGSGSPPAVPTSTLYYANGMGLTYQNGMTFYNAAAPTPGTPVAPTTDPTTIYQTPAGVFGHQAAVGHQTAFAPMMYPCPAPSLYMPQQYQYSPMPYETYYTGTATASGTPYIFPTSTSHSTNSGGNVSGSNGNATGNTSNSTSHPPSIALPSMQPQPHYYTSAAPPQTHPSLPGAPALQDHLFYSFTAAPPLPHQSHASLGLTSDQQLLFYTADTTSCQQPNASSDSQTTTQEDTHSTSSHSEHPHNSEQAASTQPLVPLMPVKYHQQYNTYPTMAAMNVPAHTNGLPESDDPSQLQACRTIVYPTALFIHPGGAQYPGTSGAGASLLPTPPQSAYDPAKMQSPANSSYHGKFSSPRYPLNNKHNNNNNNTVNHMQPTKYMQNTNSSTPNYPTSSLRLTNYHHNYGKRGVAGPNSAYPKYGQTYNSKYSAYTSSHSNYLRKKEPEDAEPKLGSTVAPSASQEAKSPPPAAPFPRPFSNVSPNPPSQMQYFSQQRGYQGPSLARQRPRGVAAVTQTGGVPRRQLGDKQQRKHKTSNGKVPVEEQDSRLPITPPGTPSDQSQLSDACHNLQALGL